MSSNNNNDNNNNNDDDEELILGTALDEDDAHDNDFINLYEKNISGVSKKGNTSTSNNNNGPQQQQVFGSRALRPGGISLYGGNESSDEDDDGVNYFEDGKNEGNNNNMNNNNNNASSSNNNNNVNKKKETVRNEQVINDIENQFLATLSSRSSAAIDHSGCNNQNSNNRADNFLMYEDDLFDDEEIRFEEDEILLDSNSILNNNNNNNNEFEGVDEDAANIENLHNNGRSSVSSCDSRSMSQSLARNYNSSNNNNNNLNSFTHIQEMKSSVQSILSRSSSNGYLDPKTQKQVVRFLFLKYLSERFNSKEDRGCIYVKSTRACVNYIIDFHRQNQLPVPSYSSIEHMVSTSLVSEGILCRLGDLFDQAQSFKENYLAIAHPATLAQQIFENKQTKNPDPVSFEYSQESERLEVKARVAVAGSWKQFLTVNPWRFSQIAEILLLPSSNNPHYGFVAALMLATGGVQESECHTIFHSFVAITRQLRNTFAPNRTNPEKPLMIELVTNNNNNSNNNNLNMEQLHQNVEAVFQKEKTQLNSLMSKSALIRELQSMFPNHAAWNRSRAAISSSSSNLSPESILDELLSLRRIRVYLTPNCDWIGSGSPNVSVVQPGNIPVEFAKATSNIPVCQTLNQESFRAFLNDFRRVMGISSTMSQQLRRRAEVLKDLHSLGWQNSKANRFFLKEFIKTNVISEVKQQQQQQKQEDSSVANNNHGLSSSTTATTTYLRYNSALFENAQTSQQVQKELNSFLALSNLNSNNGDNNGNQQRFVLVKSRSGESIYINRATFFFLCKIEKVFHILGPTLGERKQPSQAVLCGIFTMNPKIRRNEVRQGIRQLLSYKLMEEISEELTNLRDGKPMLVITFELQTLFDPSVDFENENSNNNNNDNNNNNVIPSPHQLSPLSTMSSMIYHQALPEFLLKRMKRFSEQQRKQLQQTTKRKLLFFRRGELMDYIFIQRFFDRDLRLEEGGMNRIGLLFYLWEIQRKNYFEENVTLSLPVKPFVFKNNNNNNNNTNNNNIHNSSNGSRVLTDDNGGQQFEVDLTYQDVTNLNELMRQNQSDDGKFVDFASLVSQKAATNVSLLQVTQQEFEMMDQNTTAAKILLWLRRLFLRRESSTYGQHRIIVMIKFDFAYLNTIKILDNIDFLVERRFLIREYTAGEGHYNRSGQAVLSLPGFNNNTGLGGRLLASYAELVAQLPVRAQQLLRDIRQIIVEGLRNPSPLRTTLVRELKWKKWPVEDIEIGFQHLFRTHFIQEIGVSDGYCIILRDPAAVSRDAVESNNNNNQQQQQRPTTFLPPPIILVHNDGNRHLDFYDVGDGNNNRRNQRRDNNNRRGNDGDDDYVPRGADDDENGNNNQRKRDTNGNNNSNNNFQPKRRDRGNENDDNSNSNHRNNNNSSNNNIVNYELRNDVINIPAPASQQQQQQQQQGMNNGNNNNGNNNNNQQPQQQPVVPPQQSFYYYNYYAQQHLPAAPDQETYLRYGSNYYRNPLHVPPPLKVMQGGRVMHRPGYDPNGPWIPVEQRMSPCKTPPPHISHW